MIDEKELNKRKAIYNPNESIKHQFNLFSKLRSVSGIYFSGIKKTKNPLNRKHTAWPFIKNHKNLIWKDVLNKDSKLRHSDNITVKMLFNLESANILF